MCLGSRMGSTTREEEDLWGESHPWMNVEEVSSMLLLFHGYYFCFISACNSACLFKPVHYDMCIPVTIHTNTCCHT